MQLFDITNHVNPVINKILFDNFKLIYESSPHLLRCTIDVVNRKKFTYKIILQQFSQPGDEDLFESKYCVSEHTLVEEIDFLESVHTIVGFLNDILSYINIKRMKPTWIFTTQCEWVSPTTVAHRKYVWSKLQSMVYNNSRKYKRILI